MLRYFSTLLLGSLLCLNACWSGGIEKRYTLNPPLPEVVQQSFLTQLEAATASDINIPIRVPLAALSAIINTQVPELLQELEQQELRNSYPRIVADRITITRESPIKVGLDADHNLLLGFDIRIVGKAQIALGLLAPEYPIDIRSRIALKSSIRIADDWQLQVHTAPSVSVTQPLSLSIMGYEIPFQQRTEQLLQTQISKLTPQIDADISRRIDLRSQIITLWKSLQTPFKTTEIPIPTWTLIRPTDIAYTDLAAVGNDALQTNLLLKIKMATSVGQEPPPTTATTLPYPRLYPDANVPNTFRIAMPLVMPIDSIAPLIRPQLIGQKFPITGNQYVLIENIALIGAGDRVIIKATVSGNAINGNITMVGIPQLNPDTQIFSFDQFDYTLETGNLLKDKAAWLINKMFLHSVAQKMQFNAAKTLADAQKKLQQQINSIALPQSQIKSNISSLRATESHLENNILRIDVTAEGTATLFVNPPSKQ